MIDVRTEIREAFAKEQSAFPPPAALRAQVFAEINSHARAAAPARQRADRDVNWLMVAAAALLTIAIVAGFMAVRLMNSQPTPVKTGPAPQLCVPGTTPPSDKFARVHGCLTFVDGNGGEIVAVDPFHAANRISLGPSNGGLPIAWSRDGSHLLLMSCATGCDLDVMNADGSEMRLTHGDAAGWDKGSFSRDGTTVVFDRYDAKAVPATSGLYTVAVGGGAPQLIAASNVGSSAGDSSLADPAWSPDGSRIAYADYKNQQSQSFGGDEIWIMNSDGTGQRRLVSVGQCGQCGPVRAEPICRLHRWPGLVPRRLATCLPLGGRHLPRAQGRIRLASHQHQWWPADLVAGRIADRLHTRWRAVHDGT